MTSLPPLVALSIVAAAAAAGCSNMDELSLPTAPPPPLQMNDLSVLFPIPDDPTVLPAASSPGRGGQLFSASAYNLDPYRDQALPFESLRAVGFRVDPCFGATGTPDPTSATCENQIRIVFQRFDDLTTSDIDVSVHAFYSISRAELLQVVDAIATWRAEDAGDVDLGPLAPHPILASEGLDGPLGTQYMALLAKFCGSENLIRFTALTDQGSHGSEDGQVTVGWLMHGVDVSSGSDVPLPIAAMPAGTTAMSAGLAVDPFGGLTSAQPMSPDNIYVLSSAAMAASEAPPIQQAAFNAALRIENPHDHSPNTIDCASCHLAQPLRQVVGEPLGLTEAGNPNAFVAPPMIPAADLVQTTPTTSEAAASIHAFAYTGACVPVIDQRVINETAENLALIESLEP